MANSSTTEIAERLSKSNYAKEFSEIVSAPGENVFDNTDAAVGWMTVAIEMFEQSEEDFHPFTSKFDAYLQDQAGSPQVIEVLRNRQTLHLNVTPVLADEPDGTKAYQIGFQSNPAPFRVENLPVGAAISQAGVRSLKKASMIVDVLKGMFTHRVSVKSVSGPIGIGQQVHQAFKLDDKNELFELMAFISVNLGIFNLLPIPILDGGMILFLAIESAMRRDLNQQIKERVYQVAFVCLIAFAAFVIFNDITRLSMFAKP